MYHISGILLFLSLLEIRCYQNAVLPGPIIYNYGMWTRVLLMDFSPNFFFIFFFFKKSDTFKTRVIPESSSSSAAAISLSVLPFEWALIANRKFKTDDAYVWRKEHFSHCLTLFGVFFYDMHIGFKFKLLYIIRKFSNSCGRLVNKFFFSRYL